MPVNLSIASGTLFGFLLALARVSGTFAFLPMPGFDRSPLPARVILSLAFTICLAPVWPAVQSNPQAGTLVCWLLAEATLGIAIGVAIAFVTDAFLLAAQVLGVQAGYSYASTVDPNTQADSGVLQVISQLTASLLFFVIGLDRQVIRAFAQSFEVFPPGVFPASLAVADSLVRVGSGMFSVGIRLAMPVIAMLMMIDISLALLGRLNQQLQLLTLSFPVKMLAALALLAALSPLIPVLYETTADRSLNFISALMRY
jgi:flagellar biosynthetic protein FliR